MRGEDHIEAERNQRSWLRDQRLMRLGFKDYAVYIRSDRWKEKRAEYWEAMPEKVCGLCGTTSSDYLALHHKTYERVGSEHLRDLIALCGECHHLVHGLERQGLVGLDDFDRLVSKTRAKRNRQDRLKREAAMPKPSIQNQIDVKRTEADLARTRAAMLHAIKKRNGIKAKYCQKRLVRSQRRLTWLKQNPQRCLHDRALEHHGG
jgi:hypothetical protein